MMALFAMPSFAQISEGEPRAEVLPTGNRLEQGVWGVYFGAGFTFDKKDNDFNDSKCHVTPLVNVKYMFTDNIEGRIGVEFGKNKTRNGFEDNNDKDGLQKTISSHNYFTIEEESLKDLYTITYTNAFIRMVYRQVRRLFRKDKYLYLNK